MRRWLALLLIGIFALILTKSFQAQSIGTINTVAGGGNFNGVVATNIPLNDPEVVVVDSSGNIYFPENNAFILRKVNAAGITSVVAGNGIDGNSGDGGPATSASFGFIAGIAIDRFNNIYIADFTNSVIRKIDNSGIISRVAGNGNRAYSGDGGPATSASLASPSGIAVDDAGNIFIADTENDSIRKVDSSGIITTIATINKPLGLALDSSGNLYIASIAESKILKLDSSGNITTVAGNGIAGNSGDGGPATSASISSPLAVAIDNTGNIYFNDFDNSLIRKVDSSGIISKVAGIARQFVTSGDGGPAANATFYRPTGVTVDSSGNLYVSDRIDGRVRKIDNAGIINTVAGGNGVGDGIAATNVSLNPNGLAVDNTGNFYISDPLSNRIRKVNSSGIITTVAGNGTQGSSGDGGAATSASLTSPTGIAVDSARNIYIVDRINNRIRRVNSAGVITTAAGGGNPPCIFDDDFSCIPGTDTGDGGLATDAKLFSPQAVTVDKVGNFYIAESARIRKVDISTGIISTVVGNGNQGSSGDGGAATNANISFPPGVAVDGAGNIYFIDRISNTIRKVDISTGIINTVAGNGIQGNSGDGGAATDASLNNPAGLAVDDAGDIFIADTENQLIRLVDTTGTISTIAGNGTAGFSGDGGAAINASLNAPVNVALGSSGRIYINDAVNRRIRLFTIAIKQTPVISWSNPDDITYGTALTSAQLNAIANVPGTFNYNPPAGTILNAGAGQTLAVTFTPNVTSNFNSATKSVLINVLKNSTTTQLVADDNIITPGRMVKFTATVSFTGTGTATGEVTFYDGSDSLGTATLSGGKAIFSTTALAAGPHSITAVYSGDTNLIASTSAPVNVTVDGNVADHLMLIPSSTNVAAGQTFNLTVTALASNNEVAGSYRGTVHFTISDQLATSIPDYTFIAGDNGIHTFPITLRSAGNRIITVSDLADGFITNSTTINVQTVDSSISISAPATSVRLQPINITAIVSGPVGAGTPTGSVFFYDGTLVIGTANLDASGKATFSTSTLAIGSHSITGMYIGNISFKSSKSSAVTVTVSKASSSSTVTTSVSSAFATQPVTFTATIRPVSPSTGTPSGVVSFKDGTTTIGTVIETTGVANFTTANLTPGQHSISVSYSGDSSFNASSSNSQTVTINKASTKTTISSTATTSFKGIPVTLTASVTAIEISNIPAGTVTFNDGTTTIGSAGLDASGKATLTTSFDVGVRTITANFTSSNFLSSSATLTETITLIPTSTTVTSSLNPATNSQSVTFSAKVSTIPANVAPIPGNSTVTFKDNGAAIGTSNVNSSGVATFTTTKLTTGSHLISATFNGSSNEAVSTGSLTQTINGVHFVITASPTNVVPIQPVSVTVTALDNANNILQTYSNTIQFTCSDPQAALPANYTFQNGDKGSKTFSVLLRNPGNQTISARDIASPGDNGTSPTITVVKAGSSTKFESVKYRGQFGQVITVVALVTPNPPDNIPATGTVTFLEGATVLGTSTIVNIKGVATASLGINNLSLGTHTIKATYNGDQLLNPSTSTGATVVVDKSDTTITVTSSSNPSTSGQPVTFTVTVTPKAPSSGTVSSGSVTISDGNSPIAILQVNSSGITAFTTRLNSPPANHNITVTYGGNSIYLSSSTTFKQTVK